MLRIYSDRALLPKNASHCQLLIPFWGPIASHDGYESFVDEAASWLQLVDAAEADVAVLPFDGALLLDESRADSIDVLQRAQRFCSDAAERGLETVVLLNSDDDTHLHLPHSHVFRTSLCARTRLPNEWALPAWHDDLGRRLGSLTWRPKRPTPIVGFCGRVAAEAPLLSRRLRRLGRRLGAPFGLNFDRTDGLHVRREAMDALDASSNVETSFILRDIYFGTGSTAPADRERIRREYVHNLVESDYTLCVRGYGNFSVRFYETMSVGRIPVLIDTDCVLPYDFLHDYRELCVIVPEHDLSRAAEYVRAFHDRLDDVSFRRLQRRVRDFWEQNLSPPGFFRNLPSHWAEPPG